MFCRSLFERSLFDRSTFDRSQVSRLCGLVVLLSLATVAWSDTTTGVSSQASQGSNDSVHWSQLGADGTILASSVGATSAGGVSVNVGLAGPNSISSAVCAASPTCSWSGTGFASGDQVIWTSDASAGGNGPLKLMFGTSVSGAGALIQADEPGQFTAEIQAFNGVTLLGSFTVKSNTNGDAVYIGILDQTGPNITSVTFSLTACGSADANCVLSDFAIDTVFLNVPSGSFGLSLTLAGTGSGSVSSSPAGITCPSTCSANFASGTVVTLTATAAAGSTFAGWSAACSGTGTCSVTMTAAKAVTATFNPSSSPAVTLTPTSLNFGAVATGVTSPIKTVTLKNSGKATLTITSIAITGTNSGDFPETTTCTSSLAAGAACIIKVQFKPSATGARSASVSITDNAAGSPQQVPLSGTGTTAKLVPTPLGFGTLAVGLTSPVKKVTLTNIGTTTMTISSIAVTGAEAADFPETATTCTSSLAAAASCTVSLTFKPSTTGARSANLTVTDNAAGSPQQVPLNGTGTTAELTPTSQSFGSVKVGATSAKTVTLKNVGTTAITITSITLSGLDPGDFAQTNTCLSSLAASASCTISVTFKPTTTGARSAILKVTDSAAGSPQTVALSGIGS